MSDPVFALIAAEERLSRLELPIREAADKLYFALPEAEQRRLADTEERLCGRMGELYTEAEALRAQQLEIFERMLNTRATSIAGVIAQMKYFTDGIDVEGWSDIVIDSLRGIEHRIATGDYRPAELSGEKSAAQAPRSRALPSSPG